MAIALKSMRVQLDDPRLLRQQCYVGGSWIDADSRKTITVTDPATGETVGTVPSLGVEEMRRAIEAAEAALPAWRAKTAKERSAILRSWFDLIIEHRTTWPILMTREQGKPLAEAKGEVAYGASFIEWFAEEAKRVYGDVIPQTVGSRRILVLKQPVGVCAAITPWNFPIAMITSKARPALAVGCTMVVKPASYTPFCALALAELAERAGLPKGVFNVVTGSAGRSAASCAPTRRSASSRSPAPPTSASCCSSSAPTRSRGSAWSWAATRRSSCSTMPTSTRRWRAPSPASSATPARPASAPTGSTSRPASSTPSPQKFAAAVGKLKVGPGVDEGTTVGPLIEQAAVDKVEEHVKDAVAQGAKVVTGGKPHAWAACSSSRPCWRPATPT